MLSEEDLKNQYIRRNINKIIQNIQNNNYDYCGEHHAELKIILNYLLLLKLECQKRHTCYDYYMLDAFAAKVRNIVLDDSQTDMVLKLDFKHILSFAINNMNSKLEDAIIATGDADYIFRFAKLVKGANISKLEDAIIATGDAEYIFYFARDIEDANISKLEDAIIATEDAKYIYLFARDIKGANILRLEDAIIATDNIKYMFYFARNIKGANIEKIEDAIIAYGDFEFIYYFATEVEGADIEKLEDAIIATGNAEYIYLFARDVKGANKEKLLHALINIQDIYYIDMLTELIQNEMNKDLESPKNSEEDSLSLLFSSITEKTNLGSYLIELNLPFKTRKKFINYLFANMEKGNNYLILRVYLEMLGKRRISSKEAVALDLEYAAALKEQESSTFKPQNPILEIRKMLDDDSNNN